MSNRVKIFSLALLISLATLAAATGAVAKKLEPRSEYAWAHPRHAIHVRDGLARAVWPAVGDRAGAVQAGAAAESSLGALSDPFGLGSALDGSTPVGQGPSTLALDPATHTIYVANGYNDNAPQLPVPGNTVSVIDARHCRAQDISSCKRRWPTITVGNMPSGIAIDQNTDTVYVSNVGDNTVSVFNGATCNAEHTSGCTQTPATVPVGLDPLGILADPANHTVYVPDDGANAVSGPQNSTTVSMLDSASCNATDLAACPTTPPPTVDVGATPADVSVDQATHTVYVTTFSNGNPGSNNGWTVFDANTCNATVQSGCATIGTLAGDQSGPTAAQVDPSNDTLYTANWDNTISAFDLNVCNAGDLAGCATDAPGTVTPFPDPGFGEHDLWVAVDAALHTVYVVYQKDDALLVVNTDVCNGSDPTGCATLNPSEIHTGADPESVVVDSLTQTLYTANQVDNDFSVIDAARCNAAITSGCRHPVPEAAISGAGELAADPAVGTTYVTTGANTVAMIDTSKCNAFQARSCDQTPPTLTAGTNPDAVAVNEATRTVYVADYGAGATGTVSVFRDRTCNATQQAGCSTMSTLEVPDGNPVALAVDPLTDTIYVATVTSNGGPDLISVFSGATCNATNMTGCDQTPANAPTGNDGGGDSTESVAVDPQTNTIYATSDTTGNPFLGHSVYVINGTTCDATNTSGCGQTPATVDVGSSAIYGDANPFGVAVDQATDTIYTANIADGEGPGTVSVIKGDDCNSRNTSGCGQTPATAPAGFGTANIAVDQLTNQVYASNIEDTSVTRIDGNRCNASTSGGCDDARTAAIVGDYPGAISLDPFVGTAYVADSEGVSMIHLTP